MSGHWCDSRSIYSSLHQIRKYGVLASMFPPTPSGPRGGRVPPPNASDYSVYEKGAVGSSRGGQQRGGERGVCVVYSSYRSSTIAILMICITHLFRAGLASSHVPLRTLLSLTASSPILETDFATDSMFLSGEGFHAQSGVPTHLHHFPLFPSTVWNCS
jgi:hypothetical protein